MNSMDKELVPLTIDEINLLSGYEKTLALVAYHEWLDRQRKTDDIYAKRANAKVYNFIAKKKDPISYNNKRNAAVKKWYAKHKKKKAEEKNENIQL